MRILQVCNGYPPRAFGGVELHTHRLCAALRARGHELRVFTRQSDLHRPDGATVDEVEADVPVRTVVNDFKQGDFPAHYWNAEVNARFEEWMRDAAPDVVHFQHLIGLSSDLPAIARAAGARVVATVHEYWYVCQRVMFQHRDGSPCGGPAERSCIECVLGEPATTRLGGANDDEEPTGDLAAIRGPAANRERFGALRAALAVYERIVTPTRFVIEEFARQRMPLPPDRTRALALGLETSEFPPPARIEGLPISASRPLRVGFVGQLLHHKGPHVLLEALRFAPDKPVRVDLWGRRWPDHPYDESLSRLLADDPRATYRERFADGALPDVLRSIDVLAVPSTCLESFGIATREAFLAGRPVVTSDRGALPESVRDGVDGLIVPGEDPRALAAALSRLVDEPDLLPRLARGALEAGARTKSMDRYAAELEEFLYRA